MDTGKLVAAYVKLRDARAELKHKYEEEDGALREKMDKIEHALLELTKEHGLDSIKTPYSEGDGVWIMNRKTIREVRKLKDNDDQYLWQPGLAEDQQPTILASGYREATDLAEPDQDGDYTTGEEPIVYGDFMEGYTISDRVQIAIQRLVERFSDQGAVGFQARRRVGGQVTKSEALAIQRVGT